MRCDSYSEGYIFEPKAGIPPQLYHSFRCIIATSYLSPDYSLNLGELNCFRLIMDAVLVLRTLDPKGMQTLRIYLGPGVYPV